MKKIFTLIFIALFAFQMQGQNIPDFTLNRQYVVCATDTATYNANDEEYALKIIFPEWEEYPDTIFKASKRTQRVTLRQPAQSWKILNMDYCFSRPDCMGFARDQAPGFMEDIHFKENDSFKIVTMHRLIRSASVELVAWDSIEISDSVLEFKPNNSSIYRYFKDTKNKVIYVKSETNQWHNWLEVLGGCDFRYGMTLRQIQEKLNERGYYHDKPDNIMDDNLAAAITQFQKDNNLRVGDIDNELLHLLGFVPKSVVTLDRLNDW